MLKVFKEILSLKVCESALELNFQSNKDNLTSFSCENKKGHVSILNKLFKPLTSIKLFLNKVTEISCINATTVFLNGL